MGDPIPFLGVCKGDPITYLELQVIEKLKELIEREGNQLKDFDSSTCPALRDKLLGKDPELSQLLQIIWTNQCTLSQAISALAVKVDSQKPVPFPFQLGCITVNGSVTTSDTILQSVLSKVCELQTQVNNLAPSVDNAIQVKITEYLAQVLKGLGNRGIAKSGTGADMTFLFNSFVPPYCPIPYYGPISNFDAAGRGLVGTAYEGWLLLSGSSGMPDVRGRTFVAAVKDIPGPALDNEVDPTKAENAGTNYIPGSKFGASFIKLSVAQLPSHSHSLNDPGHIHQYPYPTPEKFSGSKFDSANQNNTQIKNTLPAQTGITINASGGDQAHDNRQPSFTITGYIMRID
ncbi:hypothetical protein HGH93_21425 [Chitinophaga polysaccharea]|nr:hypothetical protein [Chitinophaga polysaccharea]